MLQPCFTAMLDGAIMATNPPTGLAAVPDSGANASTEMNAIFAALPHANTNTRNVYFPRPGTRYFANTRLDITVDGTQVICGGNIKVSLRNATSSSLNSRDPWFRGNGLSPSVRMEAVEHVRWHGGSWEAASAVSTGGFGFEMATVRFGIVSSMWIRNSQSMLDIAGLGSGEWSELCFAYDGQVRGVSTVGGDDRNAMRIGGVQFRATSGDTRCSGARDVWAAGTRTGPRFDEALDCCWFGGYSEGQALRGGDLLAGALRAFMCCGMEANNGNISHVAGSSCTAWGLFGNTTGGGDMHVFNFQS